MTATQVNIPLLRKAVEWAEAEAAKPEGSLWIQQWWASPPSATDSYIRGLRRRNGLTEDCGTAYCIAGYICHVEGIEDREEIVVYGQDAAEALEIAYDANNDLTPGARLFAATNSIADVRRIAEDIAGERL